MDRVLTPLVSVMSHYETPFRVPGIGDPIGVGFFGDLSVSGKG